MYVCMCIYIYVCMYVCIYIYIYIYICVCIYIYVCVCVCVCVCACVCVDVYSTFRRRLGRLLNVLCTCNSFSLTLHVKCHYCIKKSTHKSSLKLEAWFPPL